MKRLYINITCIILTIVLAGSTTAHAISSGQKLIGEGSEALSQISIFAGNGQFAHDDGDVLSASFRTPYSIVALPDGTVLVSDSDNQLIRSIKDDEVIAYAGITFDWDEYGIPQGGWSDGAKELAAFSTPSGMTVDEDGNVYVADAEFNLIRKIGADGQVTTIAGDGYIGRKDGDGPTARFYYPQDIAIAKDGTLYVADTLNHTIRKITVEGKVSTLNSGSTRVVEVADGSVEMAGDFLDGKIKHAKFNEPSGLVIDSKGNLYVSDSGNQLIRYIDFTSNTVTTVAGNINHSSSISESNDMYAKGGYYDGSALEASFNFPKGLSVTEENGVIIADSLNHSIRYLLDGNVYTLAESLHNPTDVAIMQDGSILIADSYNNLISLLTRYNPYIKLIDDDYIAEAETDEAIDSPKTTDIPREAQIEEVNGVVYIRRAGGAKEIRAFNGMSLSNGDHIRTEAYSSVMLRLPDTGDLITVDQNALIYISDLRNESSSKITKFFVWRGSIWVNASTLENSDDKFEIGTTTAILDIRGTTLLVGVDPATGESIFFIASGVGKVSKNGINDSSSGTILIPSQQITLDSDSDQADYDDYSMIADLNDLISNTSNAIIEAILASKAAMDQENQEYIAKLQGDNQSEINNSEAIDRINQNLDNLVGNIVNNAISQGKVDEAAIKAFIEKLNETMDKKLDLDNVKQQQLSEQEKAKQARIKLLEAERKKKQEEQKEKQEQLKKQNEDLQKKLKEQLEKQKKEKEKAAEAAKKKAAEEFAKRLADEAARLAFEAKQKALEETKARLADENEKAKQAAAKNNDNSTPPSSIPGPAPGPAPGPTPGPDPDQPVLLSVKSVMETSDIEVLYGARSDELDLPLTVTVVLSDDSEIEVPVYWTDINVYLVGTQTIIGMLDLSDFDNLAPTDLTATIEVTIGDAPELTVESIIASEASTLTVKFVGMEYVVITLTESLDHMQSEVTFTYEGREYTAILATPWIDNSVEDQLIAADIDAEIIELPSVSEMTLDDEHKVVAVRERYNNLTNAQQSLVTQLNILEDAETRITELKEAEPNGLWVREVMEFDIVEVEYGANPPNLPGMAILILSDNSEAYVPVHWSGEIDVYTPGTLTLVGTLDLSDYEEVSPTDLTATIDVIVKILQS